MSKRTLVN